MRVRLVIGFAGIAMAVIACGLSVVGSDEDAIVEPIGDGGPTTDGPQGSLEAAPSPPPPVDPFEAGIDASPDNCNAACDGGTCDGGWCVMGCGTNGGKCPSSVTCPPGIPCEVHCTGADACRKGVDCGEATACNVLCSGTASCSEETVRCKGTACQVTCAAKDACIGGIACDAGTCVLRCLQDSTCKNDKVTCHADRCTVECGVEKTEGKDTCMAGVDCHAKTSCDIRCQADNSCKSGPVTGAAGETVDVTCSGTNSCQVIVGASAADSGVRCTGTGACINGVVCDGGQCLAQCNDTDYRLCCDAGTCLRSEGDCTIDEQCQ